MDEVVVGGSRHGGGDTACSCDGGGGAACSQARRDRTATVICAAAAWSIRARPRTRASSWCRRRRRAGAIACGVGGPCEPRAPSGAAVRLARASWRRRRAQGCGRASYLGRCSGPGRTSSRLETSAMSLRNRYVTDIVASVAVCDSHDSSEADDKDVEDDEALRAEGSSRRVSRRRSRG